MIILAFILLILTYQFDSLVLKHNLKQEEDIKIEHADLRCDHVSYFNQRVDHFNFALNDMFEQRYIMNNESWQPGNVVFFYTGNEGNIELFCENTGFIWELANYFNGMVIFGEHRYYGESMPYGNKSLTRPYIQYLTTEQALADYAYMISSFQANIPGFNRSPVIVLGGSYGGMLSAWFRMKYPNLAVGALAASAPIWQMISDCDGFARVNTYAFEQANSECPSIVRQSWYLINNASLENLTKLFRLCKPLDSVNRLKDWLVDIYGNIAMANYPYPTNFLGNLPANPVAIMCANMTQSMQNNSDVLNAIYKGINVFLNYTGTEECFNIDEDTPSDLGTNAWDYQTCTEFVFPTCSNGKTDMFEYTQWDLQTYIKQCYAKYQVVPRIEWPLINFGSRNIKAHTNIIFSNGDLDPWKSGGVTVNLTQSLPAIIIEKGAHHLDLRASNPLDPQSVVNARLFYIKTIRKWISSFKKFF